MSKYDFYKQQLESLEQKQLFRSLRTVESTQGPCIKINGKELSLFCSNNYINLANDSRIVEAVKSAVDEYGYGAGGSRLVSGTMLPHTVVEKELAQFLHTESSLIFPSGWTANQALLQTLPQGNDLVLLDKIDHASIIDGVRGGAAKFKTYRRENLKNLEKQLKNSDFERKFIVTESVFSMDGDVADLLALVDLKNKYDAILVVDEAHAFGCMGPNGAGYAEELGLLDEIDIITATFSKALGAVGGMVAGPKIVTDYMVNKARGFIYTTAPSPVNAAAVIAALDIIKREKERRELLKRNSDYLRNKLKKMGFDTGKSTTHIVPVIIGDDGKTLEMSQKLFENGFYIPAIRPPTVAPGTSRLRISLQSNHTIEQMDELCDVLRKSAN